MFDQIIGYWATIKVAPTIQLPYGRGLVPAPSIPIVRAWPRARPILTYRTGVASCPPHPYLSYGRGLVPAPSLPIIVYHLTAVSTTY
ncbi:MAG: hypothetical protein GY805_13320 [Chloroflexi bacterium]|nr:hypothetical protein [Chloroflexota bacterium]